jgi:hypothetical protein
LSNSRVKQDGKTGLRESCPNLLVLRFDPQMIVVEPLE